MNIMAITALWMNKCSRQEKNDGKSNKNVYCVSQHFYTFFSIVLRLSSYGLNETLDTKCDY